MAVRVLTINQYGSEGDTHGTAVPADVRLVCEVALPASDRTVVIPKAGIGKRIPSLLSGAHVQRIAAEGITLNTPDGAYFQILPFLFSSLLKGGITPAEQNAGQNDMLWAFVDPLTGAETLDTFTLESGDGTGASEGEEIAYCLFKEATLTGNAETGDCTLSGTIDGDAILPTTMSTVATMPTYTAINGKLFRLYIDDTWASLGGSELAGALLDWTLTINGGAHLKRRGSANRKPTSHGQGEVVVTLQMTLERTAGVITEAAKYFASVTDERFIRLECDSGVIIGAGANHKLTVDIAGIWTAWQKRGSEQDGNTLDVVTLTCGYDSTGTHGLDVDVITNIAAI